MSLTHPKGKTLTCDWCKREFVLRRSRLIAARAFCGFRCRHAWARVYFDKPAVVWARDGSRYRGDA